jgi:hypothetical protein
MPNTYEEMYSGNGTEHRPAASHCSVEGMDTVCMLLLRPAAGTLNMAGEKMYCASIALNMAFGTGLILYIHLKENYTRQT